MKSIGSDKIENRKRIYTEDLGDEDDSDNLGIERPELGIYDTRGWDYMYRDWVENDGPFPGKHPDPKCVWNTDYK